MNGFSRMRRGSVALALGLAMFCSTMLLAGTAEPQLNSPTAEKLWKEGADKVLAGNFDGAVSLLEQVRNIEPGHTEVTNALTWLRDSRSLEESRERLRAENYQHDVEEAVKQGKEDKWDKALDNAWQAFLHAKDPETFRSEAWLQEVVDHSLQEIEKYKQDGKWRDALVLYSLLEEIFPKNHEYKAGMKVCRQRAHFEVVYGPKSTWKEDLRGVRADAVEEIVKRIEAKYVREPDFRKLVTGAIENLLILASAADLEHKTSPGAKSEPTKDKTEDKGSADSKASSAAGDKADSETPGSVLDTFPTLGDHDLVAQFTTRMNSLLKRHVNRGDNMDSRALLRIFDTVLRINKETIKLPERVVVDEFVAGLLEPLDEFTSVIWPSEQEEFNKHTKGEFIGVGIQITKQEAGPIRVESPLEDSPAYRAGIKPGDLITAVDGDSTLTMRLNECVSKIMGKTGTTVVLTIQDPIAKQDHPVPLVREIIKIQTVRSHQRDPKDATKWDFMLDRDVGVGYVRVSAFMEKTVKDLREALETMRSHGAKGVILDLRFNPGGLLTSAREMCELFLKPDQWIVWTSGRAADQASELRAQSGKDNFSDMPLIILVNGYSASASEIVAGALAGQKGACVIGERTFGKGSVQNLIPIADGKAYLKLTTAKYYLPDNDAAGGRYCLNKEEDADVWGVEPHIKVAAIPQEVRKVLKLRRKVEVLRAKDQDDVPDEVLDRRATSQPAPFEAHDDFPEIDPQLAAALNVMRMKLLSNQPWALAPREQRMALSSSGKDVKTAAKGIAEPKAKAEVQR